jgi:nucleotide-binding universal stress UspA family protein
MYTRILVGVDGSKESMKALYAGISLAKILDATVDVLLVISPRHYSQFVDREVISHDPDGQNRHSSLLQQEEEASRLEQPQLPSPPPDCGACPVRVAPCSAWRWGAPASSRAGRAGGARLEEAA